jgi:ribosomal protein S12 methylthiotransferase
VPPAPDPFIDLLPASGVSLTPRHYSYLKISEGCNHKCKFCIIPDMRGKLVSRPAHAVLREAEKLVEAGVRELLVISQDTSAYGVDRKHDDPPWKGRRSAPISPTLRARWASLAHGCGCITSTPTPMCAT